jgi:hypothetical protein
MPHSDRFKLTRKPAALGCNAERVTASNKLARKRQYMRLRPTSVHSLGKHKYSHPLTPENSITDTEQI